MTLKLGMQHCVLEYYQICSNDAPGLTLTYFTARSNLVPFVWEKGKTMDFSETTVQLEGIFNFPPIPVGNKTERKGLKFLTPLGVHPFRWKHCNENTGKVPEEFEGDCSGVNHSYVLYLAWPEWKGLKFYSPLWFHPFGWKLSGIAGGSQCACHKITGNVWLEPWVVLQWVKESAPLRWVGRDWNKRVPTCPHLADFSGGN